MHVSGQVRDRVIVDINAAGTAYFGSTHPFVADHVWFDQTDQTDPLLGVHVLCDGQRSERAARNTVWVDVDLIVHVVKLLEGDSVAEVDGLVDLCELLAHYYFAVPSPSSIQASLTASSLQLPTRKMLNKSRRFYAWARLTFRLLTTP